MIDQRQHQNILWLSSIGGYAVKQIEPILDRLTFQLDHEEKFLFVIENVDQMPPLCASRLLKSIEEPPPGYHFILLTERKDNVLPTVVSRCIVWNIASEDNIDTRHVITPLLTDKFPCKLHDFAKILEKAVPNERETLDILDELLKFWTTKLRTTYTNNAPEEPVISMVRQIKIALEKPVMPGSGKIFWNNFCMQAINTIAVVNKTAKTKRR